MVYATQSRSESRSDGNIFTRNEKIWNTLVQVSFNTFRFMEASFSLQDNHWPMRIPNTQMHRLLAQRGRWNCPMNIHSNERIVNS